ncbi:hypothetical protein FACS1894205_6170 [Alphaproteobacteria bacterium]|nr:hypothetical protein FACS1894205_6170 [Alphaproteobacteria bacterium]
MVKAVCFALPFPGDDPWKGDKELALLYAARAPVFVFLCLAALLLPAPLGAEEEKLQTSYVLLPRLNLPVPDNQTGVYRMLDVEAWLLFATPDEASRIGGVKAVIGERMKVRFITYQWSYFNDPKNGQERVKAVIRQCAEEVIGQAIEVRDVLIKKMILR